MNLALPRHETAAALSTPPSAELTLEESGFLRWMFEQAGLRMGAYRSTTLKRRLPACLRTLRAGSLRHARQILQDCPQRLDDALGTIVLGVTSFFRDAATFDLLRSQLLPALGSGRLPLRVWSAGCSDGRELYSVAMMMDELDLLEGAYLLGTDCRGDAIRSARAGVFDRVAMSGLPPPWLFRYCQPASGQWMVAGHIRRSILWRTADVTQVREPGVWDLILCRNVTMYMDAAVCTRLWEEFEQALRPGGYLVLGKAERPHGARRLSAVGPCIYRRDRG